MDFNGTFLVTIFSFLVFVAAMNKLLYEPIHKIVKERCDFVEANYSVAAENNQKSENLVKHHEEKVLEAKEEAKVKYNEIVEDYKEKKSGVIQMANNEASDALKEAYSSLNNVSNDAKSALKGSMTDLANDIVEKILGYRSDIAEFDNSKVDEILYNGEV